MSVLTNSKISQYANSPVIQQLLTDIDAWINPSANIDLFYSFCCDIDTAQSWGLDILGRKVGVSRYLNLPPSGGALYMGFKQQTEAQPWGQAPFYSRANAANQFALSDTAFRVLIRMKAAFNLTDCTIPAINQLLMNLFHGRGRCYVTDPGGMAMFYVFEFALQPFEVAILTQSGAIPKPAGVNASILQMDTMTFGFKQQTGAQPFNQGVFFNRATDLIPVE